MSITMYTITYQAEDQPYCPWLLADISPSESAKQIANNGYKRLEADIAFIQSSEQSMDDSNRGQHRPIRRSAKIKANIRKECKHRKLECLARSILLDVLTVIEMMDPSVVLIDEPSGHHKAGIEKQDHPRP